VNDLIPSYNAPKVCTLCNVVPLLKHITKKMQGKVDVKAIKLVPLCYMYVNYELNDLAGLTLGREPTVSLGWARDSA
jgi:hypothetical protein